jgi:hypothetical protein
MQVPVELKIRYLSRRFQDIERLRESLEQDDYSLAQNSVHQVIVNVFTLVVPHIDFFFLDIKKAALKKDKEKVKILIQKMESVLQTVQAHS